MGSMRNATVLVVNLHGLATETIKNIVLAGIGKLIVLDGANVSEEDLGAGFFLTEEDVGKSVRIFTSLASSTQSEKRSDACLPASLRRQTTNRKLESVGTSSGSHR